MRSTPTRDPIGVSDLQSQYAPEHIAGAAASVRPHVASCAVAARDTTTSTGLAQMLSLVGSAIGARKVALTSEARNKGTECHIVWRAPPTLTPPSAATALLAFAPGTVLRARSASSVVIATFACN